jgi:type VI secretion system protein ImpK
MSNPPSMFLGAKPAPVSHAQPEPPGGGNTLLDLMYDGFYALFMLKNGSGPQEKHVLLDRMVAFLDDFGRNAKRKGASTDDVDAAKYAFCAAVDEIMLRSQYNLRDAWERRPLQLVVFGDQLAGENFFVRLESLRARGSAHVQALEVFHMCLLLGFQGRYILEGSEKLNYLTARLGDEIANMKGKAAGFAPHSQRPDQFVNKLRRDVPLWAVCSVFALISALGYLGLRTSLNNNTANKMNAYNDVVKLAPRAANLTITLP